MKYLLLSSASFMLICELPATAATLAPHRAFYDLEVKRLESGNNISKISGKLAYEITGSKCDGYAINYRFASRVRYVEGGVQVVDNQMTSWESGDGLELDITQKQYNDAKLTSDSRIKVTKPAAGSPGQGLITKADTKSFETTAAAIFPAQYQIRLLEAASRGETREVSVVFEGTDDEKSMRAISFIGGKKAVSGLPDAGTGGVAEPLPQSLSQSAAWPMTISYYAEQALEDEEPVYQASFLMLENGISTNLVLDYGTYTLSGKLTKLELLKAEPCP